ncbi:MAG: RNA 2',3'-cyclic phosphodiesterase [Bacteroidales bacterium]|nr:RNA 2',3'-cyclic phosphodiesterase [Bacteroidales bacterium]
MEKYFRTFIGLPFHVSGEFLKSREDLMKTLSGERISWVDPERYHITLRFIGDTDLSVVEEIGKALHAGVTVPGRTEISMGELGSFGPRKRPRVLWLGFDQTGILEHLKVQVDHALARCGILPEEQLFRAHLTLGRPRSVKNPEEYYRIIYLMARQFQCKEFLERLVFFRSIPGPGGPEYQVLDEIPFR